MDFSLRVPCKYVAFKMCGIVSKNCRRRNALVLLCLLAGNDLIALGAMKAFKLSGYRIPDDIAVIGFDDIAMETVSEPSLSSASPYAGGYPTIQLSDYRL